MAQEKILGGTASNVLLPTSNYQFVTITAPNLAAQTAAPTISSSSTANTGGTLAQSTTFGYKLTIATPAGETTPSAEKTQATAAGTATNTVTLNFAAIPAGCTGKIYGRTSGGPWGLIGTAAAAATSFVDTGAATPGAAPPAGNTTTESVTVTVYMPDGQTAVTALDVNGNAASFVSPGKTQTFFGGPVYSVTTTGTISGAGVYADFGGRVS